MACTGPALPFSFGYCFAVALYSALVTVQNKTLKYKKEVKLMHKKYKNDLINEINARSQDIWRQINKLRKESTVEEEILISPEAWIQHFRQLLYDNNETNGNTSFADDSDETDLSDDEILGKSKTNNKGDRRSPAKLQRNHFDTELSKQIVHRYG